MARAGDEIERLRERLDVADFSGLLIGELGWDNPVVGQEVRHNEDGTVARLVADKRGVGVWVVDGLPGPGPRRRIDVLIARRTRERLVIFDGGVTQLWMWPEQRASGAGFRLVSHEYHVGSRNEALLQRLATAQFRLDEEDDLTVVDVLARVRRSFNADKVTKKFYEEFETHRGGLVGRVEGLESEDEVAWYTSVLLNRLMLLYFLQKKGFLDGDRDYLRNRLQMVREHLGEDAFYGFFRDFLLPLFHDGLGSHLQEYEDEAIQRIVGDVPYVNGGIFQRHVLEEENEIDVPDDAFEAVFGFFDRYRWHLDDRPSDDVDEINPDVLGYVFEQLVNARESGKQKGAYYTKEDVTGYMTSVTLLPAFLDRIAPVVGEPWGLLPKDPDRYIHDSVRHGVAEALPDSIAASSSELIERPGWGEKADASFGHPGETWWEVVDRRRHCERLRGRLAGAEIADVAEAITENLDLPTIVDDHLRSMPDADAVEAVYRELCGLTVLDPTCGSGAFLFAALEQLAGLYVALVERAEELAEAGDRVPEFVEEAHRHPNLRYFVLRSAQLNNLYGVDIMAEAGEIARLRLFLKLAAQVDRREDLEPFPDLDLNVKTGNLLVGVASPEDAENRLATDLLTGEELAAVQVEAREMSEVYRRFVELQATTGDPGEIASLKADLDDRLGALRGRMDRFVYERARSDETFEDWETGHLPFHWFVEFPHVFEQGGFDAVIGNPPYVQKSLVDYDFSGFATDRTRDIYASCMERAAYLARDDGWFSMVVKNSLVFNQRDLSLRRFLDSRFGTRWVSVYGVRPSVLFENAEQRVAVFVGSNGPARHHALCAGFQKWQRSARPHLFPLLRYVEVERFGWRDQWPVLDSVEVRDLLSRLLGRGRSLASGGRDRSLWFRSTTRYFVPVSTQPPKGFLMDGSMIEVPKLKEVCVADNEGGQVSSLALIAGKLGYLWWSVYGDDFDVTVGLMSAFPVTPATLSAGAQEVAAEVGVDLQGVENRGECSVYTRAGSRWLEAHDWRPYAELTDRVDMAVLEDLGLEDTWPAIQLWYARSMKAVGDAPGVVRGRLPEFQS